MTVNCRRPTENTLPGADMGPWLRNKNWKLLQFSWHESATLHGSEELLNCSYVYLEQVLRQVDNPNFLPQEVNHISWHTRQSLTFQKGDEGRKTGEELTVNPIITNSSQRTSHKAYERFKHPHIAFSLPELAKLLETFRHVHRMTTKPGCHATGILVVCAQDTLASTSIKKELGSFKIYQGPLSARKTK